MVKTSTSSANKDTPKKKVNGNNMKHNLTSTPSPNKPDKVALLYMCYTGNGTPHGIGAKNIFEVRNEFKGLANSRGDTVFFGQQTFQPHPNLRIRWIPNSLLDDLIWYLCIDHDYVDDDMFPLNAFEAYGNKIARALHEKGYRVNKTPVTLTQDQVDELDHNFGVVNLGNADEFAPADDDIERLI